MKKVKGFGLLETIIIILVTAIASSLSTGIILYNSYKDTAGITYDEMVKDEALKEFLDVYSSLSTEYYEEVDKEALLESAIDAMTKYLGDKYTTYLNEEERVLLEEQLKGEYTGIGVLIEGNTIKQVFDDSPASSSGVKVGDIIIKVNGEDVKEKDATYITNAIKKHSDKATIVFLRENQEIELTIEFKKLDVPAINYEVLDENIGYIYVDSFSSTLTKQVKEALIKLEDQNIKSLIIDVRDNSGGYLSAAYDLASVFIEEGKVIYSLADSKNKVAYEDKTEEHKTYPIIVLVNENSASASEILAAALKESYNAVLVGKTTYGKGKVQQTKQLNDGSMVKYTSARWYTPNNVCIDGKGLNPDYEVDLTITYGENKKIVEVKDTQLLKAQELLNN
ncbi:MAG: S41 family peptidase [Bacilli bacterium]|nr:S41 family peptidase [Bacilli bacterium]